jgi:hypothetical protein
MRKLAWVIALGAASVFAMGGAAHAGNQCLMDATAQYKECKSGCQSDLTDARAACRNVTPGCFLACVDARADCETAAKLPLTSCLGTCETVLDTARAQCKQACGCGGSGNSCGFNPCYIGCLQTPETVAFDCRDTCQDAFALNTAAQQALAACASGFKTCLASCPPASPSGAFVQ